MKRLVFTCRALVIACVLAGCGDKKQEPKQAAGKSGSEPAEPKRADVKLVKLDLSGTGFPLTIEAPEGATAKESLDNCRIKADDSFQLEIRKGEESLAELKKAWQAQEANKLEAIVIETPDTFLIQTRDAAGKTQFHCFANVKVGDQVYHCENAKVAHYYTQADCELILRCAKTLAAK